METQCLENIESILRCPLCDSSLISVEKGLKCSKCMTIFPKVNGIYDFRTQNVIKESSIFRREWLKKLIQTSEKSFEKPGYSQLNDTKYILKLSKSVKNKILLDAGCGTGLSTMRLLEFGAIIIFFDIIPETMQLVQKLIQYNKIKGKAFFFVGDLNLLPFLPKTIDIIWAGGVLEHFRKLITPFKQIYRVLKNQGKLIFTVPNMFGFQRIFSSMKELISKKTDDHFERGFNYNSLKLLLPSRFFSNVQLLSYDINGFYFDLVLKTPFIQPKFANILYHSYKTVCIILSNIMPQIKLGISWFILYAQKR